MLYIVYELHIIYTKHRIAIPLLAFIKALYLYSKQHQMSTPMDEEDSLQQTPTPDHASQGIEKAASIMAAFDKLNLY
jgi:hypothetical protein